MAAYSSEFKRVEKKYRIGAAERIYPASFTKYGNAYQLAAAEPRARNHRRAMRSGA